MILRTDLHAPPRLQTVAQAEEWGYRLLMLAAALLAVGLMMTVALVFVFVGVPLLIIGTLLAWGDLIWMFRIARRPAVETTCPVCGKPSRAFLGAGPFPCDECGALLEAASVPDPET
jgi:hypothetical protein